MKKNKKLLTNIVGFGFWIWFLIFAFLVVVISGLILESGEFDEDILQLPPGEGYMCRLCEQKGPSRAHIVRHYQAKHTDIRSFMCQICGKGFKTSTTRQQHVKKVHKLRVSAKELKYAQFAVVKTFPW